MSLRSWKSPPTAAMMMLLGTATAYATQPLFVGDTFVTTTLPAKNFGALPGLLVGSGATALIRFDLSSLPPGATSAQIGKATLTIFVSQVIRSGAIAPQLVAGPWSESSLTFASEPPLAAVLSTVTPTSSGPVRCNGRHLGGSILDHESVPELRPGVIVAKRQLRG
jgi:hypothetical protein